MKNNLSMGKFRGLQQVSGPDSIFTIVALDHRGSLKAAMNPDDPASVTYQQVVDLKLEVSKALAGHASGLLVDAIYGAPQVVANGTLPGSTGMVITLERSGYEGESHARRVLFDSEWTVEKIKRMGASAIKFLLYYHPGAESAAFQEEALRRVVADCQVYDIPLILECLTYSVEPGMAKNSEAFATSRPDVIIETARRLCPLGADTFKAEFPADMNYEKDEGKMLAQCQALTEAAGVPWMVLSAGVDHGTFCRQVEISCKGGASGFLAGRSMWKDAIGLSGQARTENLTGVATQRLRELTDIAGSYARPWTEWYRASVSEDWYTNY
ncbi:MAG: tagatose 1,6-diphosphate aldolase [Chloroflexi bacterium]|nr:tagatose 1,6-diphosphate aldolase [Chloroflexota bacterium]